MVNSRYHIVLASNSPRRKELLSGLDIPFEVRVLDGIDESYPAELSTKEIAGYISKKKADAYQMTMGADELIITADTIVWLDGQMLGKPHDEAEAYSMLRALSGKTHQVFTAVTFVQKGKAMETVVDKTDVTFAELTDDEIRHYIQKYRPFDKAGAYGVQEWIGYIACTGMKGSYFNVMGFPVHLVYKALKQML